LQYDLETNLFICEKLMCKQHPSSLFVILACAVFGLVNIVFAQSATATLSGAVVDEQGAIIPRASITMTNSATGLRRQTLTDAAGDFTFTQLPPGAYTLEAQSQGFMTSQLPGVVLNVGGQSSIRIQLRVAPVGDKVVVKAGAGQVGESPAVATVVDRQFVANQPLNGRSFQTLIGLAPGVTFTPSSVTTLGQFSVNGQRANANYFTVDGVSANFGASTATNLYETGGGAVPSLSAQGGTNALASVDAVQEFQIQTSTYAPEYGRQPGGQVSIVTRSGTNEFHGSVFNYLRNDVFDANDWFANRNLLTKPALRQNDFGFVFGGPLMLPRFGDGGASLYRGRNRSFFFTSYEGLRLRQPIISSPELVPSLAARQSAAGTIRDVLNAYPLPTGPTLSADPNTATFVGAYSNPSRLDAFSVRIDHKLNDRFVLFGRYNYAPSETRVRANFGSVGSVAVTPQETQTLTLGTTMIFSPRLSNDLRVNYSRSLAEVKNIVDGFGGGIVPPDSVFFPAFASPQSGLSLLEINSNTLRLGVSQENRQRQLNVVNTLSYTTGSHTFKLGADYRRLAPVADQGAYTRLISFSNVSQALNGSLALALVARADVDLHPIYHNYSFFAQDTWRLTRRLTLTYGLRYEVNPAPTDANGNLPFTVSGLNDLTTLALAPPGARFYETTYDNFAPRVGVAFRLFPERGTVVRGGFGVYYDLGYAFTGAALASSNFPYGATVTRTNLSFSSPFVSSPAPPASLNPPFPALFAYQPGYELPYTLHYNVTVEQALGTDNTASMAYVGASGRRLGRAEVMLNPNPNFTRLNVLRNAAESGYHAFQAQFQRRLSRGLQALASYTWSKSLDNVSEESISNFQAAIERYDPRLDRGPSTFDARHTLTGAVSYEIPSPFKHGLERAVFGDFGVDAIYRARTALPVNVVRGSDALGVGTATVARPDLVPGAPLYIADSTVAGGRRINRAAFSTPSGNRQGTLSRNALRGFPLSQLDMSLRRQFNFSERLNLQFRVDAFNILNTPNFANPEGRLNNTNFGVSTQVLGRSLGSGGVGLSPLYQIGGPRSLQLALKLNF
jgi:hypothetical protein